MHIQTNRPEKQYNDQHIQAMLGISRSATQRLLSVYRSELAQHTEKLKKDGDYKPRRYLSETGLAKLMLLKDKARPGDSREKLYNATLNKLPQESNEAKKGITTAIVDRAAHALPEEYLNDPIIALRIKMLESEKRLNQHDEALNNHEGRLLLMEGDVGNDVMTPGQRERLNERVRCFAGSLGKPYSAVWRDLHDITGRRSIELYTFADYKIALSRLRELYNLYGLAW